MTTTAMKIELNGRELVPRELTMRENDRVLEDLRKPSLHPLEIECKEIPISALAVSISTDTPLDDLIDLTPSQAKELVAQVRAKNPSLARDIERLGSLAAKLLGENQAEEIAPALMPQSTDSGATSAV